MGINVMFWLLLLAAAILSGQAIRSCHQEQRRILRRYRSTVCQTARPVSEAHKLAWVASRTMPDPVRYVPIRSARQAKLLSVMPAATRILSRSQPVSGRCMPSKITGRRICA